MAGHRIQAVSRSGACARIRRCVPSRSAVTAAGFVPESDQASRSSKIETHLSLKGSVSRLGRDVSERKAAIDVKIRIRRLRVIEDVGRIHSNREPLRLIDPESLAESAV